MLGAAPFGAGIIVAVRGDPPPPPPSMAAPAGQPGSRSFGNIAAALRDPSIIGPFALPEIAMIVVLVVTSIAVPLLIPASASVIVRFGVPALAAALIATEAYIRAMSPRSRRADEAFRWLAEWELRHVREVTGRVVPTTRAGAQRWLASRPERVEEAAIQIELLLFVDRIDEARALLDRVPADTPYGRFSLAALRDLVDWWAGGDGDLAAMEAAAAAIEPADGDERLRAEVMIATARVRRRMADGRATPGDAIEPLLEVRERLGHRADGQVGRAIRPQWWPVLLIIGLLFGATTVLLPKPLV